GRTAPTGAERCPTGGRIASATDWEPGGDGGLPTGSSDDGGGGDGACGGVDAVGDAADCTGGVTGSRRRPARTWPPPDSKPQRPPPTRTGERPSTAGGGFFW